MEVHGDLEEIEPALGIPVRMDRDVALGIDPKEAGAPAAHGVELLGVLGGPSGRRGNSGDRAAPAEVKRVGKSNSLAGLRKAATAGRESTVACHSTGVRPRCG